MAYHNHVILVFAVLSVVSGPTAKAQDSAPSIIDQVLRYCQANTSMEAHYNCDDVASKAPATVNNMKAQAVDKDLAALESLCSSGATEGGLPYAASLISTKTKGKRVSNDFYQSMPQNPCELKKLTSEINLDDIPDPHVTHVVLELETNVTLEKNREGALLHASKTCSPVGVTDPNKRKEVCTCYAEAYADTWMASDRKINSKTTTWLGSQAWQACK